MKLATHLAPVFDGLRHYLHGERMVAHEEPTKVYLLQAMQPGVNVRQLCNVKGDHAAERNGKVPRMVVLQPFP